MNRLPAVFLDRDGVLMEDRGYVHRVEEVQIYPGAGLALRSLRAAGFRLFIVTNQSGIGRGYFAREDVERVHAFLIETLRREGVTFDRIYVAPEAPDQPSRGRKPSPAFLHDAAAEFGIDLARSYVVGDKLSDLECGWNAGVRRSVLVRTGYGQDTERRQADRLGSAVVVADLPAAAAWILGDQR